MKYPIRLAALLVPLPAFAHPGDHAAASMLHLLTEPDHLALLAVVVALAVFGLRKLRSRR